MFANLLLHWLMAEELLTFMAWSSVVNQISTEHLYYVDHQCDMSTSSHLHQLVGTFKLVPDNRISQRSSSHISSDLQITIVVVYPIPMRA
jgi:hypothetical protein